MTVLIQSEHARNLGAFFGQVLQLMTLDRAAGQKALAAYFGHIETAGKQYQPDLWNTDNPLDHRKVL